MDKNSFFWKIADGRIPAPSCAKTLGLEFVEIDGERGTIETRFEAKPEFLNPVGNVQGGFLAAMLDDTMGTALAATLDLEQFAPTVNLNVQFHRPARLGPLKGLGRVLMRGRETLSRKRRTLAERQDRRDRYRHFRHSKNVGE
jgi:uncharacterized protein (TIGR00369 family)